MHQIPNKGHKQLRKGRTSIPGAYYSVSMATYNRIPILTMTDIPEIIFDCFNWLDTNKRIKWICIMIMPDHIHVIFQLGNKQTLSQLMQTFKRFTAKKINEHLEQNGSIWQVNYYEHKIRHDESLNKLIRYCYENPVRKNLVSKPEDYPHWRCIYNMQ